jgi:glycosyltransferase involved in cell wall biosynthesis
MTPKTLSVVIPAYNAAQDIAETLEALIVALERAPAFQPEIVLVDDGSTDRTGDAAVAACRGRVPLRVLSQTNQGRFLARRNGLEAATGDWTLLLDTRVRLDADGLAFVGERAGIGERVWNGHVLVQTAGNPIGAFWKAVAYVAWKDYLGEPRTTSFGIEEFDRYPKGTGCFFAPRSLLLESIEVFRTRYPDMRFVSDDTAVIRWIAARERIHLSPSFSCGYEARASLGSFFRQGVYRGTTFVDGHLRPESRFFPGAIAFFPLSVLLGFALVRRPWLAPVAAAGGAVAGGLVAASGGCSAFEVRSVATLAPVYGLAHGAGMWRGLALLLRKRLSSLGRE